MSIAWQIGKESNKYGRCIEIVLARNGVTGLFSRLRVNTRTLERFLYRIQESDLAENPEGTSKKPIRDVPFFRVSFFSLNS